MRVVMVPHSHQGIINVSCDMSIQEDNGPSTNNYMDSSVTPMTNENTYSRKETTPLISSGLTSSKQRRDLSESLAGISSNFVDTIRSGASISHAAFHGQVVHERSSSTFAAGWSVSNLIQGIGILGIPYAVMLGGLPALVVIFLVAGISSYTGKLLIKCLYKSGPDHKNGQTSTRLATYPDIGKRVWPKFGKQFVVGIATIEMFGAVILYVILLTKMLHNIMEHFPNYQLSMNYWCLIASYSTLPFLMVTQMSIISWFTFISVVALFSIIVCVIGYCLIYIEYTACWQQFMTVNVSHLPVSIGIIVFSYCAHVVFPNIEGTMKHPQQFDRMMNIAFLLAAIVKFIFGILAVMMFGLQTAQEVSANLSESHTFSILVCGLVFVNVFFSMPLVSLVVCERVDLTFLPRMSAWFQPTTGGMGHWFWIFLTRSMMITTAVLTAMMVPHFALVMGFIGSFTGCLLCFILPAYFYMTLTENLTAHQRLICVAIILFGFSACILGVGFSLREIIETFGSQGEH